LAVFSNICRHPKINQLLVSCSDGKVRVLFDPEMSYRGALLSVVKAPRRPDPFDLDIEATGYSSLALALCRRARVPDARAVPKFSSRMRGRDGSGANARKRCSRRPSYPRRAPSRARVTRFRST
jgi:hypothetical protein